MPRKGHIAKREVNPDPIYGSTLVTKFINSMMWEGKKSTAQGIFYTALEQLGQRGGDEPLKLFKKAVENAKPLLEVKTRRVGGANYQVPREVRPERKQALSMKWIIEAARSKKGAAIHEKLADEIIAASKNEGEAVKKRENVHKMAEANKAFAHFAW